MQVNFIRQQRESGTTTDTGFDQFASHSQRRKYDLVMYLVAIAWIYVVLMMSIAEVMHPDGTLLGAIVTFLLYGVLPLSIVLYIMGARLRVSKKQAPRPD